MAGSTMKDIRLRIRSVESTRQITKAMELVATSKLRKTRERMEESQPYLSIARDTLSDIVCHDTHCDSIFLKGRPVRRKCMIVVAGDRGLAGSYNANAFRLMKEKERDASFLFLPIGRRSIEYFKSQHREILSYAPEKAEGLSVSDCRRIALQLIEDFRMQTFDELDILYTHFRSILTQTAVVEHLLPVRPAEGARRKREMLFEPDASSLLESVLPDYLAGMIYAAVCDSVASEQAARRVAMDSATKNADKMIEDLNLRYNRARQASITQEITEIVAGAGGVE